MMMMMKNANAKAFVSSIIARIKHYSNNQSIKLPYYNNNIIKINKNSINTNHRNMSTSVLFGSKPESSSISAHIVLAEKSLFSTLKSTQLDNFIPSYLSSNHLLNTIEHSSNLILEGTTETYTTYFGGSNKETREQISIGSIPIERSRWNGLIRSDSIQDLSSKLTPKTGNVSMIILLSSIAQAFPAACAVSRAFPLYSRKTLKDVKSQRTVHVNFLILNQKQINGDDDGKSLKIDYADIQLAVNGVRFACRLGDTPASELHTDAYVEEIKNVARKLEPDGVELTLIRGTELRDQGFGGLWNVGKGSEHPPCLAILKYTPTSAKRTLAMVGKGVVFDSGGLSLKPTSSMLSMKSDMCGSAACLAAFEAIVLSGSFQENLYAVLCIVENSVDERSYRNDDILYMYSGKTVEVNNTDAEGRLILADGVSYATKHLNPNQVIELSTLTGAQAYATGTRHAGLLTNSAVFEKVVVGAGKSSGDLVYPMLYCPEWLGIGKQFVSEVADMKNSVKDRNNAPSSCAGHFIQAHYNGDWNEEEEGEKSGDKVFAHLDIAAPSINGERTTGYGVPLLIQLAKVFSSSSSSQVIKE